MPTTNNPPGSVNSTAVHSAADGPPSSIPVARASELSEQELQTLVPTLPPVNLQVRPAL